VRIWQGVSACPIVRFSLPCVRTPGQVRVMPRTELLTFPLGVVPSSVVPSSLGLGEMMLTAPTTTQRVRRFRFRPSPRCSRICPGGRRFRPPLHRPQSEVTASFDPEALAKFSFGPAPQTTPGTGSLWIASLRQPRVRRLPVFPQLVLVQVFGCFTRSRPCTLSIPSCHVCSEFIHAFGTSQF
jgi:hypothetical protein